MLQSSHWPKIIKIKIWMFYCLIRILQCSALQVYWVRPARTKGKNGACCPTAVSPDMETRKLSLNFLVLSRALHTVQRHCTLYRWRQGRRLITAYFVTVEIAFDNLFILYILHMSRWSLTPYIIMLRIYNLWINAQLLRTAPSIAVTDAGTNAGF